jgi:hypothetical protein
MATLKDYRTILKLIDRTFTHYERRLVAIREETVAVFRNELLEARIETHPTPGLILKESDERPLPDAG